MKQKTKYFAWNYSIDKSGKRKPAERLQGRIKLL